VYLLIRRIISAIVVIDELRICSGSYDAKIKIGNVSTGVCELTLEGHTDWVNDIVLLLDRRLCSVSHDCTAKIWNKDTGVCELDIKVSSYDLHRVVQLLDGRLVVSSNKRVVNMVGE
jgi:WD40 repeat protein